MERIKEEKIEIIVYGEHKCLDYKKLEKETIPKIQKDYINNNKGTYKFEKMNLLLELLLNFDIK
ncbi:hypothetical protein [Staphylococcus epidermidis]|jgi:hypothetical protein|uniref:hypothetical protein n=1 Tax=Staphylococcus epidermidis TaxID=1282 RepID=UPI0008AA2201|nr:hypothetical protein [Staphylococcus epidermidis]KAB2209964.1 hypothetical protein F9B19_11930 [Staphylococcus epidermidis]MDU5829240.1 hypothetical protein [Mixta calida]OHQ47192.1 hypothetical protein HMPREF2566_04185 [Staphylococcus sp. HMSC070A07]HCY6687726.1 hypothetical protein [Staphylococcus aureus]